MIEKQGSLQKSKIVDHRYTAQLQIFLQQQYTPESFRQLTTWISSENILEQHHGVIGIRKLQTMKIFNQQIREMDLIKVLFNYMKRYQYPQLQMEATWVVANIAGGTAEDRKYLIDANFIPLASELITRGELQIIKRVVWALANLAADCIEYCNYMISSYVYIRVIKSIQKHSSASSYIDICASFLSELCGSRPMIASWKVVSCIQTLCQLVVNKKIKKIDILNSCLLTLSAHAEDEIARNMIIEKNTLPIVFDYLTDETFLVPCLQMLSNISLGSKKQVQIILDMGLIEIAHEILLNSCSSISIRKKICRLLSNLCSQKDAVNQILGCSDLMALLFLLLSHDQHQVKRRIVQIMKSIIIHAQNPEWVLLMFKQNQIIGLLLSMLEGNGQTFELKLVVLECLMNLLDLTKKINSTWPYMTNEEKCYGVDRLSKIVKSDNLQLVSLAIILCQNHFDKSRKQFDGVSGLSDLQISQRSESHSSQEIVNQMEEQN